MNHVAINKQRYNLCKNLQDFVKYTMRKLLETDSIPETELRNLEDKDYCKRTLALKYPLLSKDHLSYAKDKNHPRYYAEDGFFVKGYYLCNDWYERNEKPFAKWLKLLARRK